MLITTCTIQDRTSLYLFPRSLSPTRRGKAATLKCIQGKLEGTHTPMPFVNKTTGFADHKPSYNFSSKAPPAPQPHPCCPLPQAKLLPHLNPPTLPSGLLSVQLALTTLIGGLMVFCPPVKLLVAANSWILGLAMLVSFALILTLSLSTTARTTHPTNLILLFAFTAAEGILVGAASASVSTNVVILAFGMTAAITTGLTLYALRTKNDFTMQGAALYTCLLSLVFASFLGYFIAAPLLHIAMSTFGAVLFSMYIVYDVQLLMGGQHAAKLSPDEYVFGAISIYLVSLVMGGRESRQGISGRM